MTKCASELEQGVSLKTRFPANTSRFLVLILVVLTLFFPFTSVSAVDDPVITFPDSNLEDAIRQTLGKTTGDICQSDLLTLTRLDAKNLSISDLAGLQYCKNATTLYLENNKISDISPLAFLTNLDTIWLNDNQISNITALASLTKLTWVELDNNQITDISPLVANLGLSDDTSISLDKNPLSVVSLDTYIPQLENRGIHVFFISAPSVTTVSTYVPGRDSPFSDAQRNEMTVNNWKFEESVKAQLDELDKKENKQMVFLVIGCLCGTVLLVIIISVFKKRH